jgi:cold shock protein
LFSLDFIFTFKLIAVMEKARPQRVIGTVKFFNKDKGFGFIAPEGGGRDVFVHVSAVQRAGVPHLNEGMRLSFATEEDTRGRGSQAVALQLL